MEVFFRIAYRRNHVHGGGCSEELISRGTLVGFGNLNCYQGCSGTIGSMKFKCTDYSVTENWSYGEGRILYEFSSDAKRVSLRFSGTAWISPFSGSWIVPITMSLEVRNDTGRINSSPQAASSPVVRVQANCNHTIRLPVSDPDNDIIRCRWASGSAECGSVCQSFPGAMLDRDTCTITYSAGVRTRYYAAALILEDFQPGSATPLSSVALQFLVLVYSSSEPCNQKPQFQEPTLNDGECTAIPAGETYNSSLVAASGAEGVKIVEFETVSPPGFQKGPIQTLDAGNNIFSASITWTPDQSDLNDIHPFCFTAVNSVKQSSEQRCAQFMAGYDPPSLVSITPTNKKVHPSKTVWTLEFDRIVQRPSRPSKMSFYNTATNALVYSVDTSISPGINIQNTTVFLSVPVSFPEKITVYVNFYAGVLIGTEGCFPSVNALSGKDRWNFTTMDVTPPQLTFTVLPSVFVNSNISIGWTGNEEFSSLCTLIKIENGMRDQQNCSSHTWMPNRILLEGVFELEVTATDKANNSIVEWQRFEIDSTPPVLQLTYTPPNVTNQGYRTNFLNFKCEDESCKFSLRVLPVAPNWKQLQYVGPRKVVSYTLPSMTNGQHYTFEVIPVDRANNSGAKVSFNGTIDKKAPVISVLKENITIACSPNDSYPDPTATDENGLNGLPSFYDRNFPCFLRRTWTVVDLSGNRGSATQNLVLHTGVKIDYLEQITVSCDSSQWPVIVSVPRETASGSSKCYERNTPVTLSVVESIQPGQYPCPGSFTRNFTARNMCTGETVNATQTITIYDKCPSTACGHDQTPMRGICVVGKCKCNKPWYGDNCDIKILDPIVEEADDSTTEEGRDYMYRNILVQGSQPLTWRLVQGPAGMKLDSLSGVLLWRRSAAGRHTIAVEAVNEVGRHKVSWILYVNTTYNAVLNQVSERVLSSPAPVSLSGIVTYVRNSYLNQLLGSVVPVDIKVMKNSYVTTFRTFTKPDGSFIVRYSPPYTDYGHYIAFAKHPAARDVPGQVEWDILGMTASPQTLQLGGEAFSNFTKLYTAACNITNYGTRPLTRLTAHVMHDENLKARGLKVTVAFWKASEIAILSSNSSVSIDILIYSEKPIRSIFNIAVRSEKGAQKFITVYLNIAQLYPKLAIRPSSIRSRLLRGMYKQFEFNMTNEGKIPAKNLRVKLPAADILKLQSFGASSVLNPGESVVLALQAYVRDGHSLGDIRGSFIVASEETQTRIPFTITVASNLELNFTVKVEDEYTYFAAGKPLVKGAQLRLVNYGRGVDVVRYTNNNTGMTTFVNITEDRYDLYVQASNHRSVKHTVLPSASTAEHTVFLERNAVTYSFSVTPVQKEDSYELEIEADFETRVPLPVVTVTPNDVDLEPYELGYLDMIVFNVTNHGLIRSENIALNMPTNHPLLKFEVPSDEFGTLEAELSIIIPVRVKQKSRTRRVPLVWAIYMANIIYSYICGDWQFRSVPIIFKGSRTFADCKLCEIGGSGLGQFFNSFSVSTPSLCNKCISSLFCLAPSPKFPGADCIPLIAGGPGKALGPDSASDAVGWIGCLLGLWEKAAKGGTSKVLAGVVRKFRYLEKFNCAFDVFNNCVLNNDDDDSGSRRKKSLVDNLHKLTRRRRSASESVNELIDGITPILINIAFAIELLGDDKWLHVGDSNWANNVLKPTLSDNSDADYYISNQEMEVILDSPLPSGMLAADVKQLVERLNNTMTGWNAGSFEPSSDDNQASHSVVTEMMNDIHKFSEKAKRKGFSSYLEAYNHAANEVSKLDSWEEEAGVCAIVRIQLKQQAALTREAFLAALEIDNKEENQLINIGVELTITQVETGEVATMRFSIGKPTLAAGMQSGPNGTWTLANGATGRVEWLLVPYSDAAPMSDTFYDVGGTLTYQSGVDEIDVPLLPSTITVKPDPSLKVHYFWEKYVEADDPFTKEIEKAVPFSLGVIIKNEGYGSAVNVRMSSSQPEIIENEKGLKISFRIIGSTMNDEPRQPSLDVVIGDLSPNTTVAVRWWMVSSLQGQFKNYSATFRNVNPLGDEKLSLLDELKIHDLVRNVRLHDHVEDDGILDFLVNDRKDLDEIPELVYNSEDLEFYPVAEGHLLHISSQVDDSNMHLRVTVEAVSKSPGWNYYKLSDYRRLFSLSHGKIIESTKDMNTSIPIENVWLRRHAKGNPRTIYHSLHIFDWADKPNMTSQFNVILCASNCPVNRTSSTALTFRDPALVVEIKDPEPTLSTALPDSTTESNGVKRIMDISIIRLLTLYAVLFLVTLC